MRLPRAAVEGLDRAILKPLLATPVAIRRPVLGALAHVNAIPDGVSVARQARGGVFGELVAHRTAGGPARILYLHGGGYEAGTPATHRNVVGAIAAATGHPVFAADYRLAPEDPAPAALEDALAAYSAMAADGGEVALAGDSAGGGLALATAIAARDQGLPAPAALALLSPWVDLTLSGESHATNLKRDAILTPGFLGAAAAGYAAELGVGDPECSPLRADLAGLPPTLIHAGAHELLLSEAEELARRAATAGVEAELRVFDGLWHDFHIHAGMLREADEALAEVGALLGAHLGLRVAAM